MLQSKTLAQIVLDRPPAAAVLRRWNLDFCCNGNSSLAEAAARRGCDAEAVVRDLDAMRADQAPRPPESPAALIRHILARYHAVHLEELLDAIDLAITVETRHGRDDACPLGLADHLMLMRDDLEAHQQKEEAVLFPMMLRGRGVPPQVLARMLAEHGEAGAQLAELDRVTRGFTAPAHASTEWRLLYALCRKLDADLREHMHLENNVLFPRFSAKEMRGRN